MNKIALKKIVIKFIAVIFLCLIFIIFSAFTYQKDSIYLTRFELALLMEQILDSAKIGEVKGVLSDYSDLSKEQHSSISKVLNYKIMNGYSDNTFKPYFPMHNLEVVSYLQRLSKFLRKNKPESYSSKQLFRLLSYNEEPSIAFEYSSLNFPKGFENRNGFTKKNIAIELSNKLISKSDIKFFNISGQIIDSINSKPIENAYISVNKQAMAVEKNGYFNFEIPKESKTADIFAVAEGYQPTEMCRDLNLSGNVTIRLRPDLK